MFKVGTVIEDDEGDIGIVANSNSGLVIIYDDAKFGDHGVTDYGEGDLEFLSFKVLSKVIPANKLAKRLYPNHEILDGYIIIDKQ